MKISDKQKEEIYFLSQKFNKNKFEATDKETSDYFGWVSDGKEMPDWKENRLITARRHFDMNLKMWKEDMNGDISLGEPNLLVSELIGDKELDCPYLRKVLKETIRNLSSQNCKFQQAILYLCQTTSTQ